MRYPEYYRAEAEIASDELGLDLTDEQLDSLAEIMGNAADMESYATGDWTISKPLAIDKGYKDRQQARVLFAELVRNYTTEERVRDGDGGWTFKKPERANYLINKIYEFIDTGELI